MAVSFPALRPTTRTYTAPEYAQLDPQYVGVVSYPRLLGSKPGRAKLSLTFENIPDSAAALIIASWMNSLTGFLPLALPPEIVSGIENANLANRVQTGQHLDWFFDGPPKQNSVIKGVSTVQVELVGDISMATPTQPQSSSALLLHMDGEDGSTTFVDSGALNLPVSVSGSVSITTFDSKFGGASGFFSSFGGHLSIVSQELAFDVSDFTGEAWINAEYWAVNMNAIFCWPVSDNHTGLFTYELEEGFKLRWYDALQNTHVETAAILPYNTWHHVAAVRSNGVITLFCNGIMQSNTYSAPSVLNSSELRIGGNVNPNEYDRTYAGLIDEFRLAKNEVSYTSNFTPPTTPFS